MVRISTIVLLCASTLSHAVLASVVSPNNAATVVQTLARRHPQEDECGEICSDGSCCPPGYLCVGANDCEVDNSDPPSPTETIVVTMKPRPSGQESSGGGLGRDAIIGISVGAVVVVLAIGYCIYLAINRRKPAREPGAGPNAADSEQNGNAAATMAKDNNPQHQNGGAHDAQGLMAGHKESGYTAGPQHGFPENDSRQPHYIASDNAAYIPAAHDPHNPHSPVSQHNPHAQQWPHPEQHHQQPHGGHGAPLAPIQTQFPQQQQLRPALQQEPPRQSTYSDVSQPTPPINQGQFEPGTEPPRQSTYSDVSSASPAGATPNPQTHYQPPQPYQPPGAAGRQPTQRQSSYEYYQQQQQQLQQQQYPSQHAGQYQAFQPQTQQYQSYSQDPQLQARTASPPAEYIPDGLRVGSPVAPYRGDQNGLIPVTSHEQPRQS